MKDRKPGWSWTTRLLHLLLAVSVTHQLFISLVMVVPQDNRPGDILFSLHENVGLATFAIILSYWSWLALRRSDRGAGALFPWFSKSARTAVVNDVLAHLASLRRLRLPLGEEQPLAASIHGLGFLVATMMAGTGVIAWSSLLSKHTTAMILEVHMTLGNVMWAYLIGHVTLALLHELTGERLLRRIFSLRFAIRQQRNESVEDKVA